MPFNSTVEKKNSLRIKPIEDGTSVRVGNALVVLQLLRQRDRLSRSELARITGVAPSTMGSLIHDLSEVGLVFEEKLETSKRGRPKTSLVSIRAMATSSDLSSGPRTSQGLWWISRVGCLQQKKRI